MLITHGKFSQYSQCAEFDGGFPEVMQEDLPPRLNIDWTASGAPDVDNIIQKIIYLDDSKLEKQRFLHSTHSAPTLKHKTDEASHKIRLVNLWRETHSRPTA